MGFNSGFKGLNATGGLICKGKYSL